MKKLSKLPDNTAICVLYHEYDEEVYSMTKGEFVKEYTSQKKNGVYEVYAVYIAKKYVANFDLYDAIADIEENGCYANFANDVWEEIDRDTAKKFVDYLNEIFKRHPTYECDVQVELDI
jgi:hypothetical protein